MIRPILFTAPRVRRTALLLGVCMALACAGGPEKRPRAVPVGFDGEMVLWWNDTEVKERGTYAQGLRNGEIEVFYKDGVKHYEGVFVLGKPQGVLTTYHPKGQVATVENYDNGILEGPLMRFNQKSGALVERTEFSSGQKNGSEQQWRESGRKAFKGQWTYNLPSGKWSHWDPIGRLVREEHYWIIGGVPTGYMETVYTADGVASVQTLKRRVDGEWDGWVTTWHDNGRQSSLAEERGGLGNGRDVSWDRTGRLVSEGMRVNGLREGVWTFFGQPGEEARTVVYVDEHPVESLEEVMAERDALGMVPDSRAVEGDS